MKQTRAILVVAVVLLLAACGRKLPDQPIPTTVPATPTSQENTSDTNAEATQPLEDATQETAQVGTGDPFTVRAAAADPVTGEQLFNQVTATGFACTNCHNANSDVQLVGPGLLNLAQVAASRVEGQSAAEYAYTSITHPNDFIVPGYPQMVMPQTYAEVFTEDQIYDLVAYILRLDAADTTASEPPAAEVAAQPTQPEEQQAPTQTPFIIVVTATPQTSAEQSQPAETETQQAEPTQIGTPDLVVTLASLGYASIGEKVFNTAAADGSSCADCHNVASADEKNGGPALLGIPERSAQNPQNLSPESYILNAIENPAIHPGSDYASSLTASQKYDLIAYLMTLSGGQTSTQADQPAADENTRIIEAIASANPDHGAELFITTNVTGFACVACHYPDKEDRLVGPGLLHVPVRAADRVSGESAEIYLYHSIINPGAYVVSDYPDMVMPRNYSEVYTEQDIFDLVAYLLTLNQ
jgi:cytochrome c2